MDGPHGNMIHSTVPPGMVGRACHFRTIDEYWYVLSGEGEIWRSAPDGHESITQLLAGVCIDIPLGTAFQYRCTGSVPLVFTCTALPPWPGDDEAVVVVEQTYSIEALTECITRCTAAIDAEFLVAEQDGDVIGYLHYDSEGPEPELHRIYVDPGRKRGGVGSALMRELHARLPPGRQYVLFVAEANTDAQAFYQRHGLVVERKVEGSSHLAIGIKVDVPPPAPAFLMRYPASTT